MVKIIYATLKLNWIIAYLLSMSPSLHSTIRDNLNLSRNRLSSHEAHDNLILPSKGFHLEPRHTPPKKTLVPHVLVRVQRQSLTLH